MRRLVVVVLPLVLTMAAWAADTVIDDWKSHKLGAHGVPDGWLGGQTWGLPQYDITIEENEGHRVLHLKSKIESTVIRRDIRGRVNLKETPILEWTWKVITLPKGGDCRKKSAMTRRRRSISSGRASRRRYGRRSSDTSGTRRAGRQHREEREDFDRHVRRDAVRRGRSGEVDHRAAQRGRRLQEDLRIPARQPGYISIAIDSDDTASSAESLFGSVLFRAP